MRNKRLIIIFSILLSVTVIVLLSSMIFSVKKLNTRCLNHSFSDPQLDAEILKCVDEVKGKSIFTINENEIIKNIEKNVPDVYVVNLERKFPDRVTVHYVRLFSYYEIASGGYYYSATYEGRITDERTSPLADESKIRIVSKNTGRLQVGDYFYTGTQAGIIKEIVSTFEQFDLLDEKAAARFDFIDIEKETDCLYIGVTEGTKLSPILIKIEGASDLTTLFDKIRLGYSTFLLPAFDRKPDGDGIYQMVYVINSADARGLKCDYYD